MDCASTLGRRVPPAPSYLDPAVYVDAAEWAELPNVAGTSRFADGGLAASKPYAASGIYGQHMSNYCELCPFDPASGSGDSAFPFTTLY